MLAKQHLHSHGIRRAEGVEDGVVLPLRIMQHGKDLGYGMLLTPYASTIAKAGEAEIAKAVDDSIPPVAPLFWGFRVMVGLGVTMLGLMVVSFVQLCRNRLQSSPRLLKTLLWSIPLPWIAIEAGWLVAELGRQPWTVFGVLPTWMSASTLSVGYMVFSLAGFVLLYTVFIVIEMALMVRAIRQGPPDSAAALPRAVLVEG